MTRCSLLISMTAGQLLVGATDKVALCTDSGKGCFGEKENSHRMTRSLKRVWNLGANELQGKHENCHNEQSFVVIF